MLTPYIIRDEGDMRRIFERKMQERQEIIDREGLFARTEWAPPKDWSRKRGLLAHVRASYHDVATRRRQAAEAAPPGPRAPVVPLDLPVPQISAGSGGAPPSPASKPAPAPAPATATATATPGGGVTAPARPNIIER